MELVWQHGGGAGSGQLLQYQRLRLAAVGLAIEPIAQAGPGRAEGRHLGLSYNGIQRPAALEPLQEVGFLGVTIVNFDIVNVLTNRYEVMALAASPGPPPWAQRRGF